MAFWHPGSSCVEGVGFWKRQAALVNGGAHPGRRGLGCPHKGPSKVLPKKTHTNTYAYTAPQPSPQAHAHRGPCTWLICACKSHVQSAGSERLPPKTLLQQPDHSKSARHGNTVCRHIPMLAHACLCTHLCMHAYPHSLTIHICMYVYTHVHMQTCMLNTCRGLPAQAQDDSLP